MQPNPTAMPQDLSLEHLRSQASMTITAKSIHRLSRPELLRLQNALGLGSRWGVIEIPRAWMPAGGASLNARRIQYLEKICGVQNASPDEKELAVTVATRYVLLLFMAPNPISGHLKPNTVVSHLLVAKHYFRAAVNRASVTPGYLLNRLTEEDIEQAKSYTEMRRLHYWASKEWWDDLPKIDLYQIEEPSRKSGKIRQPRGRKGIDPWLPLPDQFVADAGARALWLVEHMGPAIIDCAERILNTWEKLNISHMAEATQAKKRTEAADAILSEYVWKNADGNLLEQIPIPLTYTGTKIRTTNVWPPSHTPELKALLRLLQASHLFIVLLSTGARIGEALSLNEGCLIDSKDGMNLINGRTYKLRAQRGGEERDWPLPSVGAKALKQQERVATIIRRWNRITNRVGNFRETNCIWRLLRQSDVDNDSADDGYNIELTLIVESFSLAALLGEKPIHAHRCRKTLARLLALCIVGAPKIVMDLFGHKDIEMTLRYILTDPLIRAEMEEVAQAQTIMLACDAIAHADENGGPAAPIIREAVRQEKVRLAKDKLGVDDIRDLADTATLSGKMWILVRPGVVCTKGPKQAGPCTRNVGRPEPSRCRSSCENRLEQYFLRDEVDNTMEFCVSELDAAIKNDESHQAEYWIGQICVNINRFPDIRHKWQTNPIVAYALDNSAIKDET
jgi:integrase